jgi:hypothetical protein
MLEDEKTREGAPPGVARREAVLELGGAEQIREEVRDVRLGGGLEANLDRVAAVTTWASAQSRRKYGRSWILALGMGASTVVFSIFQSALLMPLPFRNSERVVQLTETRLDWGIDQGDFSEANFWDGPDPESFV